MQMNVLDVACRAAKAAFAPIVALALTASAHAAEFDWKKYSGSEVTVLIAEHPVTDGMRSVLSDFESTL